MTDPVAFDTPENIQVRYSPAGLGSRFIAWLIDQTLALLLEIGLFVAAVVAVASVAGFGGFPQDRDRAVGYVVGLAFLVFGLGNLVYYTLCELFMHGQTPGKRWCRMQVVKSDGFGLDAGSIVVRNMFRLVDSIPLTWVVPLFSKRGQRLGDMVAGTLVVAEQRPEFGTLHAVLASRPTGETYRFASAALARLQRSDIEAVEKLVARWEQVPAAQRESLAGRLVASIAPRVGVEPPPVGGERDFFLDLLAAEARRRERGLG